MKRLANITLASLALVAFFVGSALAETPDYYSDDESGYQNQAAEFKALAKNHSSGGPNFALQNRIDSEHARSFSEVQISPATCTAGDKVRFQETVSWTSLILDELAAE